MKILITTDWYLSLIHIYCVAAELILGEVCRHGVFDLFLGLFDVHGHST